MRDALEAWIDTHAEQIIASIQGILRIPSVKDEPTAAEGAPFGRTVGQALEFTLNLCESLGMKTENFDGYAGHADFGNGPEIVGVLGHLDVVPPGKDWTFDPWGATIHDGRVYSRGASDDKGPTFTALFAAKAVWEVTQAADIALSRRIRLIFGCDEESDWKCMEHYFGDAGQSKPTVAFTPDGDFPLVYAEKGSFTGVAERTISPHHNASLYVLSFESGLRPNMVPDEANALLGGDAEALAIAAHVLAQTPGITLETEDRGLIVRARGISAHGATPQEGDNAAVKLLRALSANSSAFDELYSSDFQWMDDLARLAAPDGSALGIAGTDGIGSPLTSNMGVVQYHDGTVRATFNIRYPVTWNGEETTGKFRASLESVDWHVVQLSHTPSLYVPQDQEPVKTLLQVYREMTGDMRDPLAMGGRTYATTVAPVGVAFGPGMLGDAEVAHRADEFITIERLLRCTKIYAQAIYELAR